ncbi:hypothetical protein LTS08_008711 [Lithohypha guttulata]|nr:hypothetical protein LTS08_008711 [Lithohypha guttulata]
MANTEHHLFLTTEDPYATYAPGDKVCGTANLEIVNPLLAKYVIVSLLAGHRVTAAEAKPSKQNFFHKQFTIPFHNKREDPARVLSSGKHKWKFEFTLPKSNQLPPSFCYRDELGSAEVLYCLVMGVYKTDSTCPSKETMCTLPIKYTPKRSPSISIESSASYVCQHLLVKLPDGGVFPARRKHSAFQIVKQIINRQKPAEELLHATLWLPRYAAFNDHMDVSLKIQTHDEDPLLCGHP